jgi:hypothetical protein
MKATSTLICIAFSLTALSINIFGQSLPKEFYKKNGSLNEYYLANPDSQTNVTPQRSESDGINPAPSRMMQKLGQMPSPDFSKRRLDAILKTDTLIVGFGVNDTMDVTAMWSHNGPIIIGTNGLLRITKAEATILGDIFLLNNGRLEISGSNVYLPQKYFYERSILVTGTSVFKATNVKFDYSNLSHNIVLANSGTIDFKNIENYGFTTSGTYGKPTYKIDGINEAGEFVITDSSTIDISNAKTVLLWHHLGKGSSLDFKFPKGDTLAQYDCNKSVNGFKGIEYNVHLDNCFNVMWGLMPEDSTDIKISDSKIRAVGLWFRGKGQQNINGLVDNASYTDYQPNLTDRKFRLINSSVMTWSIYTFDNSIINLTGSIVGEIGSQGKSQVTANQAFCDGTGGYVWSTDTTFLVYGFSTLTTAFRSQGYSFGILGYSALTNGVASAVGNSNLIVIQTPLAEDPVPYEGSAVWFINMERPSLASVESKVPIIGSVWIEKGPLNKYIEFGSYKIEYKRNSDTKWIQLAKDIKKKVNHDTIYVWNTAGLTPDQYVIRLTLFNTLGDSVEAMKSINLQPKFVGINEDYIGTSTEIYPNPSSDFIEIPVGANGRSPLQSDIKIYNMFGQILTTPSLRDTPPWKGGEKVKIDVTDLAPGMYFVRIGDRVGKFIKL